MSDAAPERVGEPLPDPADDPQPVRASGRWLVVAVAAVAVLIFCGSALVVRPTISWRDDRGPLLVALALALVGIIAAGIAAGRSLHVNRPIVVSLDDLPTRTRRRFEDHPDDYLPSGASTVDPAAQLRAKRAVTAAIAGLLSEAEQELLAHPRATAARLKVNRLRGNLAFAERQEHQYEAGAARLLEEARTESAAAGQRLPTSVLVAGALSVACGLAYQLTLTTIAADESTDTSGRPGIATLPRVEASEPNAKLWKALQLANCTTNTSDQSITVMVLSGRGSEGDPYVVETIPDIARDPTRCAPMRFHVVDSVAPLAMSVPIDAKITYKEAP